MVMQSGYDPSQRGVFQEPTHQTAVNYTSGQQTEGVTNIFVDKSQHTTNYVFIQPTGDLPEQFQKYLSPTGGVHIRTAQIAEKMCAVLGEMKSVLEDPASLEEKIAQLLVCLGEVEDEDSQRESHFQDFVCLLRMILSTIEVEEVNEEIVSCLTGAVTGLCETVTEQKLREFRERFRRSGLDLLRPLKTPVDVKSILQDIFPDENPA